LTTPDYISPKIRVQIEEKLFSIINFKGRRAEEVKKTLLLLRAIHAKQENE